MRRMFSKKQIEKWIDDKIQDIPQIDWFDFKHYIFFSDYDTGYKIGVNGNTEVCLRPVSFDKSNYNIQTWEITSYHNEHDNWKFYKFRMEDGYIHVYKETDQILHFELDYVIPKIYFNGNTMGHPTILSFYAPSTYGNNGQILTSSGAQLGSPAWSKYYLKSLELTEQTKSSLFELLTDTYDTMHISNVAFASSEDIPVQNYEVEIHKTGNTYGYIIAKNRIGVYITNNNNGSWGAWRQLADSNWSRSVPTPITTYVNSNHSWYFKVGRLVIANINYSLKATISQGTQVYSGFPRADTNTYVAVSGGSQSHYVDGNGNLYSNGSASSGWVFGCLVYLEKAN